jgi:copper(I)-binding protein
MPSFASISDALLAHSLRIAMPPSPARSSTRGNFASTLGAAAAALRATAVIALAIAAAAAGAHGSRTGDVVIGHPFATPSLPGTSNGAAYIANLENVGAAPDRLVRAATPVAARVELHSMAVDAQGVMRMREIDGVALAPKSQVAMRPGAGLHFMLIGLKAPLQSGTSFPMTLVFERAGTVEVTVVVQAAPNPEGGMADHRHQP